MPLSVKYQVGGIKVQHDKLAPGEEPICDFCDATPVVKRFDCEDFETVSRLPNGEVLRWVSLSYWAACHACAQLVDAGKVRALVRRSVRLHFRRLKGRVEKNLLASDLERHQRQFFERRLP